MRGDMPLQYDRMLPHANRHATPVRLHATTLKVIGHIIHLSGGNIHQVGHDIDQKPGDSCQHRNIIHQCGSNIHEKGQNIYSIGCMLHVEDHHLHQAVEDDAIKRRNINLTGSFMISKRDGSVL